MRVGALAKALQDFRLPIALPLPAVKRDVRRRTGTIVKVAPNKNGQ
jgi:hypothetical protein